MEHDETQLLIQRVAKETVHETLKNIGFDADNPREIQADLRYLNQTRKGSEFIAMHLKTTLIATLIPTFLYLLWQSFKHLLK